MTSHKMGTREEWLAARLELLEAEKELTRRGDELTRMRQELPWVPIEKEYRFETDTGTARQATGLQAENGLELPMGVLIRERLQPRLPRLAHPAGMAVRSPRVQL